MQLVQRHTVESSNELSKLQDLLLGQQFISNSIPIDIGKQDIDVIFILNAPMCILRHNRTCKPVPKPKNFKKLK